MKIKKKNTTIPINGKIVDTSNVEDKTSNAPSLRLVEDLLENYSKITQIWSGNLYTTGANNTEITSEPFETNKMYLFVVQGLSGNFRMTIPYIHDSGNALQYGYYDGTTVVRWRIAINTNSTGFYLDPDCLNMTSNTGVIGIYKIG